MNHQWLSLTSENYRPLQVSDKYSPVNFTSARHQICKLASWSLMYLLSTNMAISATKGQWERYPSTPDLSSLFMGRALD